MKNQKPPFSIDEILLFQFKKSDKAKVYSHAKRCGVSLKCYTQDKYLLGIFIPPKKMSNTDVYLDESSIKCYLDFMQRLKDNSISHWRIVYDKKYVDACIYKTATN